MENAADALKMAAAVLIFVIALSIAVYGFTKAKQAATSVISKSDSIRYYDSENLDIQDSRIVGIETVIPTLYSYFKEGYTVLFYKAKWNSTSNSIDGEIEPVTLYYTEVQESNLNKSRLQNNDGSSIKAVYYKDKITGENVGPLYRGIYGVDGDDEQARGEPWNADDASKKDFIMSLINKQPTKIYGWSNDYYGENGLNRPNILRLGNNNTLRMQFCYNFDGNDAPLSSMTSAKFLERQGIYHADRIKLNNDINDTNTAIDIDDSRIEFEGDVSVENGTGIQKRVIQYIYLK